MTSSGVTLTSFQPIETENPDRGGEEDNLNVETKTRDVFFGAGAGENRQILAECRHRVFSHVVSSLYPDNIHAFVQSVRCLGRKLGISGYQQVEAFDDPYVCEYSTQRIEEAFREKYAQEFVSLMNNNAKLREQYLGLHEEYAHFWRPEFFNSLLAHLDSFKQITNREKRETQIQYLLAQSNIIQCSGQSAHDAIKEEQRFDYFSNFVYNTEGKLRPEAVDFLLNNKPIIN